MNIKLKKWKILLIQLVLLTAAIAIGTIFDAMVHATRPEFSVPEYYFRNKIFYGGAWMFIFFRLLKNHIKTPWRQALATSFLTAAILQTKYYLLGYNLFFVFFFLGVHFIVFLVPAYFIFRKFPRIFSH